MIEVLGGTLNTMLSQSLLTDIDRARRDPNVDLHHIVVAGFNNLSFRDFGKTKEMVQYGYDRAKQYLAAPAPAIAAPPAAAAPVESLPEGVTEYMPPYLRP